MLARFLCKLFKHRRSGRRARRTSDGVVSVCRRCGVPMRRNARRQWEVWDAAGNRTDAPAEQ